MRLDYIILLDWVLMKSYLTRTAATYYWVETNNAYHIRAQQGPMIVECLINIQNPANNDQTEFEASYKI